MRSPSFAERSECFRGRHLAQAIRESEPITDAEVIDRQDVGAAELEDQHHLDSPATDPTHSSQTFDDCEIFERNQRFPIRHDAFDCFRSEIFQCTGLRVRESNGAQRCVRRIDHLLRRRKGSAADVIDEALENIGGRGRV